MTRRGFFHMPVAAVLARALDAQDLPAGGGYREYHRVLPDFLGALAARACRARSQELSALTSRDAIRQRQIWARDTFWRLIGGELQRTPLNARAAGRLDRDGYRVEKIVYESRPRLFVPALLYVPAAGHPPYPGVLFQAGHAPEGKAAEPYQRCCQALAKLGFLVLAFDPAAQGERVDYPDDSGTRSRLAASDDAHNLAGKQMLLAGDTMTRLQLWDAVRGLDYLAGHPLADPHRLGAAGHSGGGTLTMMLAAVDDRLSAAAVLNGNTENFACEGFLPPGSADDAEQNLIGAALAGFDRWDLLYPLAPRPLLIRVSELDSASVYSPNYLASGRAEFEILRKTYGVLGAEDALEWQSTPLGHDLAEDSRLALYNWLAKRLDRRQAGVAREPSTHPEPEAALRVSRTGNILREFGGESPMTLTRRPSEPGDSSGAERIAALDSVLPNLLALASSRATPFSVLGRVRWPEVEIQALEVEAVPGVWLPAWMYLPRGGGDLSRPAILALHTAGRSAYGHEGGVYPSLAAQGFPVCAADVRGIGDTAPGFGPGSPRYARDHAREDSWAWASAILGRPLAGQRTNDVLRLASAVRAHPTAAGRRLRVAASGRLTIPALFAAALDPGIAELYLNGPLVSYASVLEAEEFSAPLAGFVPSILQHTDLPEIAGSLAPRPVVLAGAVDASGNSVAVEKVRTLYPHSHVLVREAQEWDEAALSGARPQAAVRGRIPV